MPKPKKDKKLLPAVDIPFLHPRIDGDEAHADGGIGLRHLLYPLVVHVERANNTPVGTLFELFWANPFWPVATNFIREGDEELTRVPFTVPVDSIVDGFANPVFARITTGDDGEERETVGLNLRVSRLTPGDRDPDQDKEGNQNLVCEVAPDVLFDVIDDERARAGVEIIFRYWENMEAYSLLVCVWGSEKIEHRVQPHEVGRDITLVIDATTIAAAGSGQAIPVGYQVIGPTGNPPDLWALWSEITWLHVDLTNKRPEAPYLLIPDVESVIDATLLGDQNVTVGFYISEDYVSEYALATLIWNGTDDKGRPVVSLLSEDISRAGGYEVEIENALVIAIAQGRAVVHFMLQGAGMPDINSKKLFVSVVGDAKELLAPTIDQDTGGYVDPTVPEATVRFASQLSWPDFGLVQVVLVTSGSDNSIEYRSECVAPSYQGDMTFSVINSELVRFDGREIEVFYIVQQPDVEPQESPRRKVQVGLPVQEMPAPEVEHALDGELKVDDIDDYALVVAPVTDTAFADWVTLYWIGLEAQTSVKIQVAVAGDSTEHPVLRDFVEQNRDERVKVFYTLERAGRKIRYSDVTSLLIV